MTLKDAILSRIPPPLLMRLVAGFDYARGEPELRLLKRLVPRDRIALDVGANYGVYSYFLSRLVPAVHAFEPNPGLADYLERAVPANVTVHRFGLSDHEGVARMRIPVIGGREIHGFGTVEPHALPAQDARTLEVALRRLDDQKLDGIGFVKIDVEGHEGAVLAGGAQTLARNRPRMIVEIEPGFGPGGMSDRFAAIAALGYTLWCWRYNRLHEIRLADAASYSSETLAGIHNYICLPDGDAALCGFEGDARTA